MRWNSLWTRWLQQSPVPRKSRYAGNLAKYRPQLQVLEDRLVPTAYVFVDFGDNFPIFPTDNGPQRLLTTTVGAVRDVATAQLDASGTAIPFTVVQGPQLTNAANTNYSDGTAVNFTRFNFAPAERSLMLQMVRRAFASVNVNVVELTAGTQTLPDGRNVTGAATLGEMANLLRGNGTDSNDAYILVATPAIGPSGDNPNNFASNGYGGIAPVDTVLGELTDLESSFNNHDDLALAFVNSTLDTSNPASLIFVANTIAHEAGHALGLRHAVTTAAPASSRVNNLIHTAEVMSYLSSSDEFYFSRFPMVRGDNNTDPPPPPPPGGPPPSPPAFSNNDLAARQGQQTPYDQLRVDPNVGPHPQRHFISGTGAHDVIDIVDRGPQGIRVTIRAFADVAHTAAIRVPGRFSFGTLPLFSYSYNLAPDRGLLIEAGPGDDIINLSAGATAITLNAGSGNDVINLNTGGRHLAVAGEAGDDVINVNFLARGMDSVTLDGGSGRDQFRFSPTLGSLNNIQSSVTVNGLMALGNDDALFLNDANAANSNRSYEVTDSEIRLPGRNATIFYSNVGQLDLLASTRAGATVNIFGTASETNTVIDGAAVVNVGGPHANPIIGGTFTEPVRGRLEIRNSARPTELNITDTGNSNPRSITLEDRRVLGMTGAPIVFGSVLFGQATRLSTLTINAGSGGNSVVVADTFSPARVGSIGLNTGTGADTVRIEEIHTQVNVNGQRGRDTVNIGRNGNLDGLAATLVVTNSGNWSEVNVDDRNDPTSDTATLQFVGAYTHIVGLTPANGLIRLLSKDLSALNIWGGSGNNNFVVNNAPASTFATMQTTLHAGSGHDTVNVNRTFGAFHLDGQGGLNQLRIGSPTAGLNRIEGPVHVSGPGGINLLSVNDTPVNSGHTYVLDQALIHRTDVAEITHADIFSLELRGGGGSDTFSMHSTELGAPLSLFGGGGTNTLDYSSLPAGSTSPGLVSWYPGEGHANDVAGTNHGTLQGDTSYQPGRIGESFQLDGDGDYIRVPNSPTLEPTAVSVEAWVKSSSIGPTAYIVAKGASYNTAASYALYTSGGGLKFYIFDGFTFVWSPDPGPTIWDGEWHHVVGTFAGNADGGMVRLYVDGAEIGEGTSTSLQIGYNLPTSNDLFIGSYQGTSAYKYEFPGQIDEPSIYNRALSGPEVQSLFLNGKQAFANGPGVKVNLPAGTATGLSGITGIHNVTGSSGNDIVVGNGGNILVGGNGRDLLIAGAQASLLVGGDGEDLLLGGWTDYDTNFSAQDAILAQWSRTDLGYAQRVNNLMNGVGVPALNALTVHRNGGMNLLGGGLAEDFFFAQLATELLDRDGTNETWLPI